MSDASFPQKQSEFRYAEFGDYFALLKPRVMSLVIFTAAVGMLVAPGIPHPIVAFATILCVAIGAGASGALNMWWDADIDRIMKRTLSRPIPSGRVTEPEALQVGLWLSALSVGMLTLFGNWLAAGLLAFTIFFYAVVYSMFLKRSTPQNIVIGGAAGAFPPMIGWAISTGGIGIESVLMFMVIFVWTPPHFWALALFMKDDYSRAGIPMMTVVRGHAHTRRLIFMYSLALAANAIVLAFTSVGGWVYLTAAVLLNAVFVVRAFAVLSRNEQDAKFDEYRLEKKFFFFSIFYLFALFSALLLEKAASSAGLTHAFAVL